MKQKLIDLMSDVEYSEINLNEWIEFEIEDLLEGIDLERVERLALSNRHPQLIKVVPTPRKKKINKWLLCAVLATLLISGTVVAKEYMNRFQYFFGEDLDIPEESLVSKDNIQSVNIQSVEAVNMEVKEAIVSGNTVTLMISFTKKDGSPFDDTVKVGDITARWDADMGGAIEFNLVEDNRELLCLYKMSGSHKVEGETIKITANSLYETETVEKEMDIQLNRIYEKYPINTNQEKKLRDSDELLRYIEKHGHKQLKKYPVEMPLQESYPDIQFEGVSFINGNLVLIIHSYWTEEEKALGEEKIVRTEARITKLIDTRDQTVYEADNGHAYLEEDELGTLYYSEFEGITVEDLPYLRPIVQYEIEKPVAEGIWEQEIVVEGGAQGFSKKFNEESEYKIGEIQLEEITVSSVGVTLTGKTFSGNKQVFEEPIIKISTTSNQIIPLDNISGGNDSGNVVWAYEYSHSPVIDTKTIEKIYINDWEILVQNIK